MVHQLQLQLQQVVQDVVLVPVQDLVLDLELDETGKIWLQTEQCLCMVSE